MSLTAGTRLGPYEILGPLGSGGMAVVYRAKDTRLERTVALKVLSPQLSTDPQLRQRFEREARAVSSLNHPNICALYDIGEASPTGEPIRFFVMELVDGVSLADRLARGPLPLAQALQCGIEIVDALSSAHRRGIVHRDVKPGNVMLTKNGAKLLDFGVAKSATAIAETMAVPSPAMTTPGMVIGTFQYMAPEQLEGRDADARSDIFAIGAVLFEMITGRRAVSSTLTVEPPALDRAIAKCLAKDPDARWQAAADLRDELKWIADVSADTAQAAATTAGKTRERIAWAMTAIALVAAATFATTQLRSTPPPPVVRFSLSPPDGVVFAPAGAPVAPFPAVSPDGTRLVFVANRTGEAPTLWVQRFDSSEPRQLADTTVRTDTLSPGLPFWSPDSRSIAFFADGKLKRIDADGGQPRIVCDAPQSGGGSWGPDDTIIFASRIDEGLWKVNAGGGTPAALTKPDQAQGELSHSNPAFLSDGRHFLFWVQSAKPSIRVGSLDSPATTYLLDSDSRPGYGSGFVLFVRQNVLLAQKLDASKLAVTGAPITLAEDVRTFPLNGRSAFSLSNNGVLVYRKGGPTTARTLAWHDRTGKVIATVPRSAATYIAMSLARDDRHLVAQIQDANNTSDLWLVDLEQGSRTRITSHPKNEGSPVHSPDGRFVVFTSDRNGIDDLFRARADGAGDEQQLLKTTSRRYPTDWSTHWISFTEFDAMRKQDLWVLDPGGAAKPYLQTEFNEHDGHLSPDERWMIYASDEAGADAVYLRPFPDANAGKWRVSGPDGGGAPRWSADGKEIYYVDQTSQLNAVSVKISGASPVFDAPRALSRIPALGRAGYAVSRDGQRFLRTVAGDASRSDSPLSIVLNWTADRRP